MLQKKLADNIALDIHDIEYLICQVGGLWRRLLHEKVKKLGMKGLEKRVLFCIGRHPGMTQVQAAELLEIEPQNLVHTLDKLCEQGWIEKRAAPKDRRVKCLHVTASGEKIMAKVKTISKSIKPHILAGVTDKKTQELVTHLLAIRDNLFSEIEKTENTQ